MKRLRLIVLLFLFGAFVHRFWNWIVVDYPWPETDRVNIGKEG